jgi:glyoxylase-like metal-dependent hydrolase (beta-lactamase superfamily II)
MPDYAVYAIRYASHTGRTLQETFIMPPDPHEVAAPLIYYVWAIVGDGRTIVVDAGMTRENAQRRGRAYHQSPAEGLAKIGIDASRVADVIITHMHWDHAGTWADFPNARFHLQDREMRQVTGRNMLHAPLSRSYWPDDVEGLVRQVYKERVEFHDGDDDIAPGISLHLVGGHARGLQIVRVHTQRGWVVLASDATHFFANMEKKRLYPTIYDAPEMVAGWETCKRLADSPDHIVPGHDPLVLEIYPAAGPGLEGEIVRLDRPPTPR